MVIFLGFMYCSMIDMEHFPSTGKIQNNFFKSRIFPYCGHTRSEVEIGPHFGVDVSIVNLGNGLAMAMTSDPLSLIPTLGLRESAWLSVQLMANDMATTGYAPMYAQFVLTLRDSLSAPDFEIYWKHIHSFCKDLGIAITGGHTGRFAGLNSTVSGGGTMITVAPAEDIITSKGARPGDVIVMTKSSALLATAILAMSFPKTVTKSCGDVVWKEACDLFYQTSAVEAGLAAGELHRHTKVITAMHDVTEGGVLGALCELAHASECGLTIDQSKIPIGTAQQKVCEVFTIDPLHCVGAGAMIITVKADHIGLLIRQLKIKNIRASIIGRMTDSNQGLFIKKENVVEPLTQVPTDPYWDAFFSAHQNGWQ